MAAAVRPPFLLLRLLRRVSSDYTPESLATRLNPPPNHRKPFINTCLVMAADGELP
jgi:hypothetical protein